MYRKRQHFDRHNLTLQSEAQIGARIGALKPALPSNLNIFLATIFHSPPYHVPETPTF